MISLVQERAHDHPHHPEERWRVANIYASYPQRKCPLHALQGHLGELGIHLL